MIWSGQSNFQRLVALTSAVSLVLLVFSCSDQRNAPTAKSEPSIAQVKTPIPDNPNWEEDEYRRNAAALRLLSERREFNRYQEVLMKLLVTADKFHVTARERCAGNPIPEICTWGRTSDAIVIGDLVQTKSILESLPYESRRDLDTEVIKRHQLLDSAINSEFEVLKTYLADPTSIKEFKVNAAEIHSLLAASISINEKASSLTDEHLEPDAWLQEQYARELYEYASDQLFWYKVKVYDRSTPAKD
jgi:hypothetical protein